VIGASILKARRLASVGRVFGDAIRSLGPAEAASLKRFGNAWRAVLRGQDTPAIRSVLLNEGDRLRAAVERLPNATASDAATRYDAAMALWSRAPGRSTGAAKAGQTATDVADELKRLATLAQDTSTLLEPAREKLVAGLTRELGNHIGDLFKRAGAGQKLARHEQEALIHLLELKTITGGDFQDVIEELSRESVRQLKDSAIAPLKRTASKVNALQGAVAQGAFLTSNQFKTALRRRLLETQRNVRKYLDRKWTTSAITQGRIFIVKKSAGGFTLVEYVDGALVVHEARVVTGRLAKGFVDFSAQVKAEVRVTALPQNLHDELRRTPDWATHDAILMIPSGKNYRVLQLVAPPIEMPPQRLLIAAEGGTWPANIQVPPSVYGTLAADGPLTRDGCRAVARYVLSRARAALR
jgi:hypothetical protein